MASVRIHRQSCELGRLPPVCICCGESANYRPRHMFYFRRPPSGEGRFAQWILSAVAGMAAVIGPGARLFMPWIATNRWRASVEFPVPLCDAHRRRLTWPDYFLWGLLALVVIALAVLVPSGISVFKSNADDAHQRLRMMESVLSASIATAAVLMAMRFILWLTTVRVTSATPNFIDMAAVAPEFVDALRRTSTATVPGYAGQSMGVPLAASVGLRQVWAVGTAMVVLILGCGLLGYIGRASTIGQIKHHAARFHAHAKTWQNKVVAEAQKRLKDQEPATEDKQEDKKADEKDAAAEPSAASDAAPAENLFAAAERNALEDAAATPPVANSEPLVQPRLEEFKIFGRERFPPQSREIRDTSQLQEGMEVWASTGKTWYLSKVVRVDSRMTARIRFPASAKMPERPIPATLIRLPAEGDGTAARDGGQ